MPYDDRDIKKMLRTQLENKVRFSNRVADKLDGTLRDLIYHHAGGWCNQALQYRQSNQTQMAGRFWFINNAIVFFSVVTLIFISQLTLMIFVNNGFKKI